MFLFFILCVQKSRNKERTMGTTTIVTVFHRFLVYFNIYNNMDFIYLLRGQKRSHNFIGTPDTCHCNQGIEDTSHFILPCPSYATQRATIATCVIEVLQRNNLNHLGNGFAIVSIWAGLLKSC